MVKVIWKKFGSRSGCIIAGTNKFLLTEEQQNQHMMRAAWLTSAVEGNALFGTINSYDGAGISAGLEHKVAVLPKNMKQGPLWKLIHKLEVYSSCKPLEQLFDSLKQEKMYIAQDGKLRHWVTGKLVSAKTIRNVLTPSNGKVPKSGLEWDRAKHWAILFHKLFSDPATYKTQINSTIEYLVENNKNNEEEAYKLSVGVHHPTAVIYGKNISDELDFAWCVYHSYTPNAPGLARKKLIESNPDGSKEWPARLIKTLGTTNYGRWADTFDGGNRYDRTRIHAIRSDLWSKELFNGPKAIMPKNL